jgi:hypothetical protein
MNVQKKPLRLAFVCLALATWMGCGGGGTANSTGPQACTEIGCGPSLEVSFSRASWPAGNVNIVVVADGTTTNCSVTLPFASCDETSGCALPAAQHAVSGLLWSANGPSQVTITVSQDGTMLGTQSFQPTYTTSEPNGAGCPPVCTQSSTPSVIQL